MPRFDNEGFDPKKRIDNDKRDRHVPDSENYYKDITPEEDYIPSRYSDAEVVDNQQNNYPQNGYNQNDFITPSALDRFESVDERKNQLEREQYQKMRASQREQRKRAAKKKKSASKKRRAGVGIIAVIVAIILILVLMVEGVLGKVNYDEHKDNHYVTASELKSGKGVRNILLLGVDARANQKNETSRPDTMMLLTLDRNNKCIKMTSFLRDCWVYVPPLEKKQRINAATGKTGYTGVVDTIEYNFGVEIDGYVVTNFEMFRALVDSVGGVEVNVTKKEAKEVNKHKKRYGNVKLEAGTHNLTGEQALAYCRIRKIDTDFNRTKRQRTVMTALLDKAKKNPLRLYKMANASAEYIETDLTKSQLRSVAFDAMICIKGDMFQEKIPFTGTWEYERINGADVIALNVDKNKEKLIDFIYNKTVAELKAEEKDKE